MFDKNYYVERKAEIQKEYQALVNETEAEIERLVSKKYTKTQELQAKLKGLEDKEKASQETETKKVKPAETAEPAKK